MDGDINKYVNTLIHELNMRLDTQPDDVESKNYNLGLETAKVEAKKLLKRWKEIQENSYKCVIDVIVGKEKI